MVPTIKKSAIAFIVVLAMACKNSSSPKKENDSDSTLIPAELVNFIPHKGNPVFSGGGNGVWDEVIRERGYILKEADGYHMWYTGYRKDKDDTLFLGYASSPDGINWTRYKHNPIFTGSWTEDMMVVKSDSTYIMFAEGRGDTAHMLTSMDKIHWKDHGSLQIQYTNGQPLSPGPYGTPTVWREDSTWYLFYERNDSAIWLASSKDLKVWRNVQDEAVISKGPGSYDKHGVALNQVIKHNGTYYGYYHGTAFEDWSEWSTNVAVSTDLRNWKKFEANPIMKENKSSGILVHDGSKYRLYTMHPEVCL
ncbi:MAG TPA: glycosylase, partial [Chitinophagaceae bacterium]|nr:glycosylase [Chitinophagaceae bacterium]